MFKTWTSTHQGFWWDEGRVWLLGRWLLCRPKSNIEDLAECWVAAGSRHVALMSEGQQAFVLVAALPVLGDRALLCSAGAALKAFLERVRVEAR